jgi:Xaa-Pro aminopeptidase
VDTGGLETRRGSKTFRWHGSYLKDLNEAVTLRTDLNVLAEQAPTIPEQFRDSRWVFLANTHPALQQEVIDAIHAGGLVFDHPPIVGFGPNAANPHYEPRVGADRTLARDEVVLLDLWGGRRLGAVHADQTWMGFSGSRPPAEVQRVWEVVRDARDAAIAFVQSGWSTGKPLCGFEVDRVARAVITEAGYGAAFVHRTGHSIDHRLHGSGPHLDDYETHDDRQLLTGTGFSVEPGVYLEGRFGVRSEVNMYLTPSAAFVTPTGPQRELITGR